MIQDTSYLICLRDRKNAPGHREFNNVWLRYSPRFHQTDNALGSAQKNIRAYKDSRTAMMQAFLNDGWTPHNCSINTTPKYPSILIYVNTEDEKLISVTVSRILPEFLFDREMEIDKLDRLEVSA